MRQNDKTFDLDFRKTSLKRICSRILNQTAPEPYFIFGQFEIYFLVILINFATDFCFLFGFFFCQQNWRQSLSCHIVFH